MSSIGEKLLKKWNYQQTGKEIDFKFQSDKKGIGFSSKGSVDFIQILDLKYNSKTVSEKDLHLQVIKSTSGGDTDSDEEFKRKVLKKRKRNSKY